MRTIKFRAWDKANGMNQIAAEDLESAEFNLFVPNATLMQYTGLKDKNGKEIYEGDILKWGNTTSFVVWSLDGWRFNSFMEQGSLNLYGYVDKTRNQEIAEVIGNIYENKDLLEEKV